MRFRRRSARSGTIRLQGKASASARYPESRGSVRAPRSWSTSARMISRRPAPSGPGRAPPYLARRQSPRNLPSRPRRVYCRFMNTKKILVAYKRQGARIETSARTKLGAKNTGDPAAPRCCEIEGRLIEELDIPVMHDDQHGTAIVVLAGLMNAAKAMKKDFKNLRVVICGAGAAGTAGAKLLRAAGITDIVLLDRTGAIYKT